MSKLSCQFSDLIWISDLIFVKQRAKRASLTKKPEPEVKEHYLHTCKAEAQALANRLQKPEGIHVEKGQWGAEC